MHPPRGGGQRRPHPPRGHSQPTHSTTPSSSSYTTVSSGDPVAPSSPAQVSTPPSLLVTHPDPSGTPVPDRRGGGPSSGDPSTPPVPELSQATPAPSPKLSFTQMLKYGKGSAAMPESSYLTQQQYVKQQLDLGRMPPPRPGNGGAGKPCTVKANHFFAELPDKDFYQYAVNIKPVVPKVVNLAVMERLVDLFRVSGLGNLLPVYDGRRILYSSGRLPFEEQEFDITLVDEDGSERNFSVGIKFLVCVDLRRLRLFMQGGEPDAPHEVLQALNIVLREEPTRGHFPVGRSFYYRDLGEKRPLGEGLECLRGFYQSIRPTQMGLSLNVDMSSTAFIAPLKVSDFVNELLNRNVAGRPLSGADIVKVQNALTGVKVEVTHRGDVRSKYKYRISGLTDKPTRDINFLFDGRGQPKSIVEYFKDTYKYDILHTELPCLQVGNQARHTYLPMEVCQIVEGQRYSKRLSARQLTALLKVTCQPPHEREKNIVQTVRDNDLYAKEFGIKISGELASVEARILPAPKLRYRDGKGKAKDCMPQGGWWNMKDKKMVKSGRVNNWICINFSGNVKDHQAHAFCNQLAQSCQISGMEFACEPLLPLGSFQPEQVERVLKTQYRDAMNKLQGKALDLLIVILPSNNGSLYGDLKRICETDLGIVSQCCLTKHVLPMKEWYLTNLSLKINVKVGGRNTVLVEALSKHLPVVNDEPTIIFGADVTHPGDDSSPSIAAVVASQDWPEMTNYRGLVCAQDHSLEFIQDLYKKWEDPDTKKILHGGMITELLKSFYRANGTKPKKIIFYRDGVGEGQFKQVLLYELAAIRQAWYSIEKKDPIRVTFVVVQKRHHTRLFLNNYPDCKAENESVNNIVPGTVVDSKICHPTQFDFYLCSHAGIRGTSRPAHYHVLWDDNKFTADGLQLLTYNLCYTYARCTKSVSIVPPVIYAHLLAYRARFYVERGGMGGGAGGPIHANLKPVMFYC